MKKVLMLAFIYPPLGGSGVQRTLKFSKYLPEFGWQPSVVCSDDPQVFQHGLDPSLLAEIPASVRVWRRRFVDPLGFRRRLQKLLGRPGGAADEPAPLAAAQPGQADDKLASPGWRRLLRALASPLAPFEFPPVDAALYWALAIVPGCLKLIRREKIDVIYSTSFPYSDHVAGYLLKKLTGKPWVADFRDPWTQNASARNTGWRYRVDQWVEQKVLHTADRVIGVTPSYTADLLRLAPGRPAEHFVTIENGYDQADFPEQSALPEAPTAAAEGCGQVTLAHVGFVYHGTALPFLRALEALGPAGAKLKVRFVGGLPADETAWLADHAPAAQVTVEPRRPHAAALEVMRRADVLLLFALGGQGKSGHYPGKLFEYMASGRPILMIGPEGDAAELVQGSGTGCFVEANKPAQLLEVLQLLARQPEQFFQQHYQPQPEVILRYERKALTRRLAALFDEQVDKNHP